MAADPAEAERGRGFVLLAGIDWTAPRVASATWALPQRMSAIAAAASGPNSSCLETGEPEVDHEDGDEDR